MNLRKIFKEDVACSAFRVIDGELRIIGKFGQVSTIDDYFDIWFIKTETKPKLKLKSISPQKMAYIQKMFPVEGGLQVLTGEACYQTKDAEIVRQHLSLLGIKKKRKLSPETIKKMTERLAKHREDVTCQK